MNENLSFWALTDSGTEKNELLSLSPNGNETAVSLC